MKIYQLYFGELENQEDFRGFYFAPANVYEKKLGSLFLIGGLGVRGNRDKDFLPDLAAVIKKEFFQKPVSSEKNLKRALKKGNEYLRKIAEKGDVDWIPTFTLAIINVKEQKNEKKQTADYSLNFSKAGNVRIKLLRNGEVLDLGEKVEKKEIEPYPLTVFFNVVSGKLRSGDRILILNNKLYQAFLANSYLKKIAGLSFLNSKKLSLVLGNKEMPEGFCLLVELGTIEQERNKKIVFKKEVKEKIKFVKKIQEKTQFILPQEKLKKLKAPPIAKKINLPVGKLKPNLKKAKLIGLLLLLILVGRLVSVQEEKNQIKELQSRLKLIETETAKGTEESYLQAWNEIQALAKESARAPTEIKQNIELKKAEIEKKLIEINKLAEIGNLETVLEFKEQDFVPEKMVRGQDNIFIIGSRSKKVGILKPGEKISFFETENIVEAGGLLPTGEFIFLDQKGGLSIRKTDSIKKIFDFEKTIPNFLVPFSSNVYLLNPSLSQILCLEINNKEWNSPQNWLENKELTKKENIKAMAIDGGIWILREKEIDYYFKGKYKKTLSFKTIFPELKGLKAIFTGTDIPYLYLVDSLTKRIIVINKDGEISAQYYSRQFQNLKDVLILENEEKIYVLDGMKIYRFKPA